MARPTYPPYDFICPYTDNCPYLNGLSTTWVFGQYQRADDLYHEHLRIIDNFHDALKNRDERIRVLERDNAELKAKYQALHQKQFKANKKTKYVDRRDDDVTDKGNTKKKSEGCPSDIRGGSGQRRKRSTRPFQCLRLKPVLIAVRTSSHRCLRRRTTYRKTS